MNIKIMSADQIYRIQWYEQLLYSFMHEMVDGDGDGNHQMEKLCITFKKYLATTIYLIFFPSSSFLMCQSKKSNEKKNLHACVYVAFFFAE